MTSWAVLTVGGGCSLPCCLGDAGGLRGSVVLFRSSVKRGRHGLGYKNHQSHFTLASVNRRCWALNAADLQK